MKNRHTGIFLAGAFFVSIAVAAIFCSVAFVAIVGKQMLVSELPILFLQTTFITWLYIVVLRYLFEPIVWLVEKSKNLSFKSRGTRLFKSIICLLCTASVIIGNAQSVHGVDKNPSSGMVTSYTGLKPGKTIMVMNGEELNHTDIPLGESFTIINSNVTGLVVKDNQVSYGCAVKVIDEKGNEVINIKDLFKTTGGVYPKEKNQAIKCTVKTGNPMQWDEYYTIVVKFWDKNGKGIIEHKLKISTSDIP